MRWKFGAPPTDAQFQPELEGWRKVRMPGPYLFLCLAMPVGVAVALLLKLTWTATQPEQASFALHTPTFGLGFAATLLVPVYLAAGFFLMILVHELVHASLHPRGGLTDKSWIGVWPTKFMFYAVYLGGIRRNRYLLMGLMPFLVLSLLPLLVGLVCDFGAARGAWALISIANGFSSCGDLILVPLLLVQVPAGAEIRDDGWNIYWRAVELPDPMRARG